jgi:hypothetical protein
VQTRGYEKKCTDDQARRAKREGASKKNYSKANKKEEKREANVILQG